MSANVDRCHYGCSGIVRPEGRPAPSEPPKPPSSRQESEPPKPAAPAWEDFDRLPKGSLEDQSIEDLRKYAANKLGIVGASKIRGGKAALLPVILAARAA